MAQFTKKKITVLLVFIQYHFIVQTAVASKPPRRVLQVPRICSEKFELSFGRYNKLLSRGLLLQTY